MTFVKNHEILDIFLDLSASNDSDANYIFFTNCTILNGKTWNPNCKEVMSGFWKLFYQPNFNTFYEIENKINGSMQIYQKVLNGYVGS